MTPDDTKGVVPDHLLATLAAAAKDGKVEIINARGEFACNSSSSHSIVIIPPGMHVDGDDNHGDGGYGWDTFTLSSSTSKIRYLAAMLQNNPRLRKTAAELRARIEGEWDEDDYVDHQSVINFPQDTTGTASTEFVTDLGDILTNPRVLVLGGNDNDSSPHPLLDDTQSGIKVLNLGDSNWRARKDTMGGESWWVLFNQDDGTKVRLRVEDPANGEAPKKSPLPELADVKITDRCAYEKDCGFCYMGSTTKGVEGDPTEVMNTLFALAQMGVFEIAFGGGEPTLWPHMEETMRLVRSMGMVPNFTTKNYTILKGNSPLLNLAGAVAFSVNDVPGWTKFTKAYDQTTWHNARKVTLQIIPEIVSTPLMEEILAWCAKNDVRLTLLGYKTTGRGNLFDGRIHREDGFWIPLTASHGTDLRLAIDTVLAEKSQEQLKEAGVPDWCYHTVEGKSSLYVDAVTGHVGPSSYCTPEERTKLDMSKDVQTIESAIRGAYENY